MLYSAVSEKRDKEGCDEARKITMNLISEEIEVFEKPEDMRAVVIGKGIQQILSKIKVRVSVGSKDSAVDGMMGGGGGGGGL